MRTLTLLALLSLAACDGGNQPSGTEAAASAEAFEPSTEAPADVAAPPEDAQKTPSGLAYKVMKRGDGTEKPDETSRVTVHYTGWTTDGERFDSSRERGTPATFGLQQVIAGWTEGLQLMAKGDHVRLWIPEELAYKGAEGKPAGMLVFDVELLDFTTPPKPPEAPPDVAAVPDDATKTESGLAYKVVKKGPGGEKPTDASFAVVHYAGWTTDGTNFDFSRRRDEHPAAFGVSAVIPGWTEGLKLMEVGDTYRFWIPPALAYEGKRGPQGTLVFDVELLEIHTAPDLSIPADATTTDSGLKFKLLTKSNVDKKLTDSATDIQMNWIGWTEDGTPLDSNLGRPPAHPMGQLRTLKGLDEGAKLLNKGEKARFWIPQELAFNARPGAPEGMLIFDLELVDFKPAAGGGAPASPH